MKKTLALILIAILLLGLIACGGAAQTKPTAEAPGLPSLAEPDASVPSRNSEGSAEPQPNEPAPTQPNEPAPTQPNESAPAASGAPATESPSAPDDTVQIIESTGESQVPDASTDTAQDRPINDAAHVSVQSVIESRGAFCGVLFLGYADLDTPAFDSSEVSWENYLQNSGIGEKYPFVGQISPDHIADAGGTEVYCIIPLNDHVSVSVCQIEMDENGNPVVNRKPILETSDGKPFILRCNVSDVIPNSRVTLITDGVEIIWEPGLSMDDSHVLLPEKGVCDLS